LWFFLKQNVFSTAAWTTNAGGHSPVLLFPDLLVRGFLLPQYQYRSLLSSLTIGRMLGQASSSCGLNCDVPRLKQCKNVNQTIHLKNKFIKSNLIYAAMTWGPFACKSNKTLQTDRVSPKYGNSDHQRHPLPHKKQHNTPIHPILAHYLSKACVWNKSSFEETRLIHFCWHM